MLIVFLSNSGFFFPPSSSSESLQMDWTIYLTVCLGNQITWRESIPPCTQERQGRRSAAQGEHTFSAPLQSLSTRCWSFFWQQRQYRQSLILSKKIEMPQSVCLHGEISLHPFPCCCLERQQVRVPVCNKSICVLCTLWEQVGKKRLALRQT